MKKLNFLFSLVFSIIFISSVIVKAQDKGFGFGIMIGQPTGFSAKYWLNNSNAIDFGLGYSLVSSTKKFSFHADYLYHLYDVVQSTEKFPLYYGFGFRIEGRDDIKTDFGARGVIGIAWFSQKVPVDLFFEIAPVFRIIPNTSLDVDAGLGVRYFFN